MSELCLDIDSSLDEVPRVGAAVREHCLDTGLTDFEAAMVELAIVEGVNNAITHAYAGRPGGRVGIVLNVGPEFIDAEISDGGPPVDPQRMAARPVEDVPLDRESLAEHGRGLDIIRGIFEDVSFARMNDRNRLKMSRRRVGERP